jgi:integrase
VVWNHHNGELWRRTRIAIERFLKRRAKQRGVDPATVKLAYGRAAEFQRRAVIHLHIVIRLDGYDPDHPDAILPPPPVLDAIDLVDAVEHAARTTHFWTAPRRGEVCGLR